MTAVSVPTLPSRLAERYETDAVLGRGVGSVVVRAHDTLLGRDAAVKTFRVESDPRAGRELCLLARFDHPGLVPVYDVEERDGRAFVVMALLDGGSLATRLEEGAGHGLGLVEALRTTATVGGALEYLHRADVLHRSVTPANVLYDADGRAHLSDFGVALIADAPRITDTGMTVGAAPYLAPEQVRGEPACPASDVYALGLVLIETLTGRRAFPGDPLTAAQARLDRPPTVPAGLPGEVETLLGAMTAADPADRPDAADVSTALRRALVAAEPPTAALITPPRVSTTGPAASTGPGALTIVGKAMARRPAPERTGSPRATGTRGAVALAGLAASALLAGTVAVAASGPVAEVSAVDRPSVVAGGAAVDGPDPAVLPGGPEPVGPPAGDEPDADADHDSPEPTTRSEPTPSRSSRTTVAQPVRAAHTEPIRTTKRTPARTTEAQEPDVAEPTTPATGQHDQGGTDQQDPAPVHRSGAVGQVLGGVGGAVDGVLGGVLGGR